MSGKLGSSWTCAPLANVVVDYVRASCSVYLGWQDNCDGCSTAPAKFGRAADGSCENGAGTDNTCSLATLGSETINLFGLDPDGDVDGNDKLHAGLHCIAPAPDGATSTTVCPPGQFVAGTLPDGSFRCESPAPLIAQYFTDHCSLTFGWQGQLRWLHHGADEVGAGPRRDVHRRRRRRRYVHQVHARRPDDRAVRPEPGWRRRRQRYAVRRLSVLLNAQLS